MADFEIALSEGPNVKDLKIVWTPETGLPKIQSTGSSSGVLAKYKPQDVLQEKNLVDGLYVPPLDPKKQRKLARKNVKETAGAKWYDSPPSARCRSLCMQPRMRRVVWYSHFLNFCAA